MAAWNQDKGRAFTKGSYAFRVDGIDAGWCTSFEGGMATADVVTEKLGSDHLAKKHLGPCKYEPIKISCGTGMTKGFYQWIKTTWDNTALNSRKGGEVITADYDRRAVSRLEFKEALIEEFSMPALDASSKDAAKMNVSISPEMTRMYKGDGNKVNQNIDAAKQKQWLTSNFRIRIDGLEEACAYVNKIEALSIKQKIVECPVGELRDYSKVPASIEIPNLVVTFSESHAENLYKWHEDFVIKGLNTQNLEKGGTLEYLTSDLKTVLFTLKFHQVGIFKLNKEKLESKADGLSLLKAEMYVENIEFDYNSGAVFA